jgi:proteic killer suppression protein
MPISRLWLTEKLRLKKLSSTTTCLFCSIIQMDLSGLKLHELSGPRSGVRLAWVSGNWRVTFRFEGTDAEVIDDKVIIEV